MNLSIVDGILLLVSLGIAARIGRGARIFNRHQNEDLRDR